jgi:hypothetical protein
MISATLRCIRIIIEEDKALLKRKDDLAVLVELIQRHMSENRPGKWAYHEVKTHRGKFNKLMT